MEKITKFYSASVSGTGNNNGITLCKNKKYLFESRYKLRVSGERTFKLFFSNLVETTGNFSRGTLGGEYTIKKAYASLEEDGKGKTDKTVITFSGNGEKKVSPGEIFSCDEFLFTYEKDKYMTLSFEVEADSDILLPTTNESATTGRIFVDGEEIFSDGHSLRPIYIGVKKPFSKTVGFFGDSITQGTRTENDKYEAWAHRIGNFLPDDVSMWNIGMGWSRAYDAAAGGLFSEKAAMCDIVFMCFGVNDIKTAGRKGEEIIEDLEKAKSLMEEKNPDIKVYFMTVPPFDLEEENERKKVNEYIRKKCENEYFDIAKPLEDGEDGAVIKEYKADECDAHPNGKGGEAVFEEFKKWVKKWQIL